MVKHNRFFNSRFSILSRFAWFVRFSKCRFFLQRDRLADSRFDCIRRSFLSCVDRTARFDSCEPDSGVGGSLTRENSSCISVGVNMVSRTGWASWWKNIVVGCCNARREEEGEEWTGCVGKNEPERGKKGKREEVKRRGWVFKEEKGCKTFQHVGPESYVRIFSKEEKK